MCEACPPWKRVDSISGADGQHASTKSKTFEGRLRGTVRSTRVRPEVSKEARNVFWLSLFCVSLSGFIRRG